MSGRESTPYKMLCGNGSGPSREGQYWRSGALELTRLSHDD